MLIHIAQVNRKIHEGFGIERFGLRLKLYFRV